MDESVRRRTRRGALAVLGVAASAAIVIGALQAWNDDNQSTDRSSTTSNDTDPAPKPVHSRWDPLTVADQPSHPMTLPTRLAPPDNAASVAEKPMRTAVIAWPEKGKDLRLLGTDGEWRSVPGTADAVTDNTLEPVLSNDGQQVAMATNAGILVVDVTSGDRRTIRLPKEIAAPWEFVPELLWLPDEKGLVVLHWKEPWVVGLDGKAVKAPYDGTHSMGLAVDSVGSVVEYRGDHQDLRTWQDDQVVSSVTSAYGGLGMVARHGRVAFVGADESLPGDDGPLVLDTATGALVAYAPIRDPNSIYSDNGHLSAKGFLDKETVLLLVGPTDFDTVKLGTEKWHLVAWHLRTGEFERITTGDTAMQNVDVAGDVLAADWNP